MSFADVTNKPYIAPNIGNFYFKNKVEGQPLDIFNYGRLIGEMGDQIPCLVCKEAKYCTSYSAILEWGDTKSFEEISTVCYRCLANLHGIARNGDLKRFNEYIERGGPLKI